MSESSSNQTACLWTVNGEPKRTYRHGNIKLQTKNPRDAWTGSRLGTTMVLHDVKCRPKLKPLFNEQILSNIYKLETLDNTRKIKSWFIWFIKYIRSDVKLFRTNFRFIVQLKENQRNRSCEVGARMNINPNDTIQYHIFTIMLVGLFSPTSNPLPK